ncbi:hypothetical protein ACQ4PT_019161 [Festuca glaucescens]
MVAVGFLVFLVVAGLGRGRVAAQGGRWASLSMLHGGGWQRSFVSASASSISSGRRGSGRLLPVLSIVEVDGGVHRQDLPALEKVGGWCSRAGEVDGGEQIRGFATALAVGVAGFGGGGGLGSSPADVAQSFRTRPLAAGSSCGLQSACAMVRLLPLLRRSSASSSGGSFGGDEGWWWTPACSSSKVFRDFFVIPSFFRVFCAVVLGQLLFLLSSRLFLRMHGDCTMTDKASTKGLISQIPSASGTTPLEEEQVDEDLDAERSVQGDEDLDAERSVEGEEDGYEEGAWGEEGEEDGYEEGARGEEGEEGEEVPGKAIWVRGSATLQDAPKTEEGKLVVYVEKPETLGLVATRGRRPSGILTIILKKYWPGLYRTTPDAPQKLALKWEDYHAAPCGVFTTTQDGRQIVPTYGQVVLRTFWEHYKVSADTDQREATKVLELMAKNNLRDMFYHIRKLAISHYFAEQGKRRNKDRLIAENLTIEDDAGWERICPTWCLNKKDGWSALVSFWTEDEEFKAKSIQNKVNRGKGGTHNQGNKPFPLYEKDMEIPRLQVWQTAHKKKDLVEGKVVYYGKTKESMESYKKAFKSLRGEDSDPLDEMAVMISGGGKPHGRTSILNEARRVEAYEQLQEKFQQKMQEYDEASKASRRHESEQTKALFEALRTGAQPPQYVEPPVVPPLPRMPTKTEFLAQLYGGTPVSAFPYY